MSAPIAVKLLTAVTLEATITKLDSRFLNRGDIAVLWDSYWSRGLVLCVLAREKNLKESICPKLTNECWKTYSENYGES